MYYSPLTKTSMEILAYLCSKINESFTIREIARALGKDYKITYISVTSLERQRLIIIERRRPATSCRLNTAGNHSVLAHVEGMRAERFLKRHRGLEVLADDLLAKIASPFFVMVFFGSYAKETASERSDLDLLLVVPGGKMREDVSAAIGSVQHVSPIGIHEVVLAGDEFRELLKRKEPNVAREAVDNHIVLYGAETFYRFIEAAI